MPVEYYAASLPTPLRVIESHPPDVVLRPLSQPLRDVLHEAALATTDEPVANLSTSRSSAHSWTRAAHAAAQGNLSVLVLGASVAAGCGAAEPPLPSRCLVNTSMSDLMRWKHCNQSGSWVRHFADGLRHGVSTRAGTHGVPGSGRRNVSASGGGVSSSGVSTALYARNAISVRFFSHCTDGFLSSVGHAHVHIIVIDAAQLEGNIGRDLGQTLERLRASPLSSGAAIVFVSWRKQAFLGDAFEPAFYETMRAHGGDVLHVSYLVRSLLGKWSRDRATLETYRQSNCVASPFPW